jgi:hypothetical protein
VWFSAKTVEIENNISNKIRDVWLFFIRE